MERSTPCPETVLGLWVAPERDRKLLSQMWCEAMIDPGLMPDVPEEAPQGGTVCSACGGQSSDPEFCSQCGNSLTYVPPISFLTPGLRFSCSGYGL